MSSDSPFPRNSRIEVLDWKPLIRLEVEVDYANAVHVHDSPDGGRSLFPITGGTFLGDRLEGEVLPGGCDWIRWRSGTDGAWLIAVRLMMQTTHGAAIAWSTAACPGLTGRPWTGSSTRSS